jgi:hypothetical protein
MDVVQIVLALVALVGIIGAFINRCVVTHVNKETRQLLKGRSIGWQFIRLCVLLTGIPVVGILAVRGVVPGDVAVAFISAGAGYAFGKAGKPASS